MGYSALYSANGDEDQNTAIGAGALQVLDSDAANLNVAVGYEAGKLVGASTNLTQAIKNTYIGAQTTGSDATNASNETVLGYGAAGNGSNTITFGDSNITALHSNDQLA